jgi:hypothetical protein
MKNSEHRLKFLLNISWILFLTFGYSQAQKPLPEQSKNPLKTSPKTPNTFPEKNSRAKSYLPTTNLKINCNICQPGAQCDICQQKQSFCLKQALDGPSKFFPSQHKNRFLHEA